MIEILSKATEVSILKKEELRTAIKTMPDIDEEELLDFDADIEQINKAMSFTMEISGHIMRIYKENITEQMVNFLAPHFAKNFTLERPTETEGIDSLCFFIDMCEHLSLDNFNSNYKDLIEHFYSILEKFGDNPSISQSVAFGLGVLAERADISDFGPYRERVYNTLNTIINCPETQDDDEFVYAVENSISSLGKLVYFQKDDNIITDQVCQDFLNLLPLKEDPDEGQAVHKQFCKMIMSKNASIMPHIELLKGAMERLNEYHSHNPDKEILDEEGEELMKAACMSMLQ